MPKIQHLNFVQYATRVLVSLFIVFLFSSAHAASIGRLSVLSSAGQPFRAEAEVLFVFGGEFESMSAKLASKDAFKRANIAFNPAVENLRFSVEQKDSRYFIRITSQQPITEPNLGIVLELTSSRGRSERGYVVLLDPVKWNNLQKEASKTSPIATIKSRVLQDDPNKQLSEGTLTKPVEKTEIPKQVEAAAPAPVQAPPALSQAPTAVRSSVPPVSPIAAAKKAAVEAKPASYQVNKGDTLRSIVARFKPDNISLEQMLVATYRRNPDAFMNNNMNLLRLNATIEAPAKQSARKISDNQARRIVRAQAAAFHQYRDQLAGEVARAPRATVQVRAPRVVAPPVIARAPVENKRSTSGQITTRANEPRAPEKQGTDKLELSKGNIKPDNQSVITLEEKLAIEKSLEDANVRMAEMEKNINELRGLLDVINKNAVANQAVISPAVAPEGSITTNAPAATVAPAAPVANVPVPEKKELFMPKQPVYTDLLDRLTKDLVFALTVGGFVILIPILLYIWYRKRKAKKPTFTVPKYKAQPKADKGNDALNVASAVDRQRDELEKQVAGEESYPDVISGKDFLMRRKSYTEEERKALFLDESEQNENQPELSVSPDNPGSVTDIVQLSGGVADSSKIENVVSDADLAQVEAFPAATAATVENVTIPVRESVSEEKLLPEPQRNDELAVEELAEEESPVDDMAETINLIEDAQEEEPEEEIEDEPDDDVEEASSVDESVEDDSSETELPEELPEEAAKEEETAPLDFDFSKINLDLEAPDVTPIESVPENPDMEVKLELALAYMDMADKEGARDLLEEVAELGTPQQAIRAKEILSQL